MIQKFFNKDTLFKIHGWIGFKLSLLFFVVCFSGTLAVFSHEMDWLFNPAMRAAPAEELASRNEIIDNVRAVFPEGKVTYWQRSREPYLTDIIYVNAQEEIHYVFANQYTGEVQGYAGTTIQRFFRDLHYYLFIPNQVGNYIVLFFGFVLVISLVTGILYYKDWYKKLFILKTGKGKRAFYSSLHKLMGAWSIPFMALISATCVWYFVERSDIPEISPYMDEERPVIAAGEIPTDASLHQIDFDKCVAIAQKAISNLEVKNIIPPSSPRQPVYLTGTSHVPLVRYRANRVYINPYTYEVMKVQQADELNTITWLNDIADPLHFGHWGGFITKFVYFIFGLTLSGLILTGPWLFIKRRLKLLQLKNDTSWMMGKWKYIQYVILFAALVYMVIHFEQRYHAGFWMYLVTGIALLIMAWLGYYIYEYSDKAENIIGSKVNKENKPKISRPQDRPKVVLKKKDRN